jgi:pilus assembly protein CpaB
VPHILKINLIGGPSFSDKAVNKVKGFSGVKSPVSTHVGKQVLCREARVRNAGGIPKNMSRRAVLVIVALAVAALSTALLTLYVRDAQARADARQDLVQVLVAKQDIPAGTTGQQLLDSGWATLAAIPKAAANPDALSELSAKQRTSHLAAPVYTGEQILRKRLTQSATSRLAIPEGLVAISVKLDDPARVAGYVEPGSRVAIFATMPEEGGNGTRLLLDKVDVLEVGANASGDNRGDGTLMTLAVNEEGARKIIFAQTHGSLYVALINDKSAVGSPESTNAGNLFPTP